jgi:hypothetical protein
MKKSVRHVTTYTLSRAELVERLFPQHRLNEAERVEAIEVAVPNVHTLRDPSVFHFEFVRYESEDLT